MPKASDDWILVSRAYLLYEMNVLIGLPADVNSI